MNAFFTISASMHRVDIVGIYLLVDDCEHSIRVYHFMHNNKGFIIFIVRGSFGWPHFFFFFLLKPLNCLLWPQKYMRGVRVWRHKWNKFSSMDRQMDGYSSLNTPSWNKSTYVWYCCWRKLNSSFIRSSVSAIVNFIGPCCGGPCKKDETEKIL